MLVNIKQTAEILKNANNILIISHKNPDGDTLGSAYSLYYGLVSLGKTAQIACSDDRPKKFDYLTNQQTNKNITDIPNEDFDLIVGVDIADKQLFGDKLSIYAQKIDLCIDHHPSNKLFAKKTCLVETASATCEIIYDILSQLNVEIEKLIATCLYTGIATDTGCFKFSNTTAKTHYIAAKLIEAGVDYSNINREMFEKKSRARILLEQHILKTMEFFLDNRCAVVLVSKAIMEKLNVPEEEFDGVSAIPRQIEGVYVGVTFKEIDDGYKISVRTNQCVDASRICKEFGGGGHHRAAGCVIKDDFINAKKMVLNKIEKEIL